MRQPGRFWWSVGIEATFLPARSPTTARGLDLYELTGHYERWADDVDLMAGLSVAVVRYGLPWPRINPVTDMPDSRAKQSAGNLPDGTAYQVNNPADTNRRSPLVVTLSKNGHYFDKAFALRFGGSELQARRYDGKAKTLGYSYPKSMVHDGHLYVAYSVNKEDVEYTRVPLTSLAY